MERRVVITGLGAVTPVGNNAKDFWANIKEGKCGIDFITKFDTTDFNVKVAGEVKDFSVEGVMDKKDAKRMDLFCQYAVVAADEALKDSGIDKDKIDMNQLGVIVGTGVGGLDVIAEQVTKMNAKGPGRISPLFIPMCIGNMAAGQVSIYTGARGASLDVVTACSSSTDCIGEAYRKIKHGYIDYMLAGGAEGTICEIGIGGFEALKALSLSDDPQRASIPFDKERGGFVMGEGAGILFLESLDSALERGAKIYGEIVGYGSTSDAYHMTSPLLDGDGAAKAMEMAIKEAGISKEEVGYINAHGTGTKINDAAETLAIKKVFGDYAKELLISSTKSMTGHLLGATGAVEAMAATLALDEGIIPPTINNQVKDEDCDLNYVPNKAVKADIKYALSNTLGFGGHNTVLCLKKWEGQ